MNKAASSTNQFDAKGELSHADFDELIALSRLAGEALPGNFHEILTRTKFLTSGDDQSVLGERLGRTLLVQEKFGSSFVESSVSDLVPTFSLVEADHQRLSKLCIDMRKIVFSSQIFDEPHKRRLLNRIAAIENEALKEKGNLDTVLAGIVDVGDALGAFGKKVEPLTKRMQEIAGLARKGSPEYDQLPSPDETKALPSPDED